MQITPATLLIVDDYPDALDVWGRYLRSKGFSVLTADDGLEAIAVALDKHPDLIVLDLELPGKSGIEVAKALQADPSTRAIPLIAATGYSHLKHLNLARQAGFSAVIVKPCDPKALLAEIHRLLPPPKEERPAADGNQTTRQR